jgi:hypothetical protein
MPLKMTLKLHPTELLKRITFSLKPINLSKSSKYQQEKNHEIPTRYHERVPRTGVATQTQLQDRPSGKGWFQGN